MPGNTIREEASRLLKIRIIAISGSLLIGLALMATKFYVFHITQSSAVLSDALESIINVVASAFALVSIIMSAKPPDESHPYGHGKIEYFSAGFEGALIILAAAGIFSSGISHLWHPQKLPNLQGGLLILLATAGINLVLGITLIQIGKRTFSLPLTADGQHVLSDVYTSLGVLIGLVLVFMTGWYWLDGLVACFVGIHIVFIGIKLLRMSFSGLMDETDTAILSEVSQLLADHKKDFWIEVHQLRAQRSGNHLNIDFHIILPFYLSLKDAHDESVRIEKIIVDHFKGNASVLVHLDPCKDLDCPVCKVHDCQYREHEQDASIPWDLNTMQRFDPESNSGDSSED